MTDIIKISKATDQIQYCIKNCNYKPIFTKLIIIQNEYGNDNEYRKHLENYLPELKYCGWRHLFMDETYN